MVLDCHQSSEAVRKAASSLILAPDSPNAVRICIAVPMTSKGTKMGALHQFISTFFFMFFFFYYYYYSFLMFLFFLFFSSRVSSICSSTSSPSSSKNHQCTHFDHLFLLSSHFYIFRTSDGKPFLDEFV